VGYTCSTKDPGNVVYDLFPPRFRRRSPVLSTVGRLDRDTSGLLLLTDDGARLHRIVHPKSKIAKIYEATLARDLRGDEVKIFASGKLMLESEKTPLASATLEIIDPRHARLTLTEGRYHQARRMFAAVGTHVEKLHRSRVGGLELGDLKEGEWKLLSEADQQRLFAG
jgi:16S rRNA pseudouridine516 synthase